MKTAALFFAGMLGEFVFTLLSERNRRDMRSRARIARTLEAQNNET